jgi:cytochrome c-type biogenesis protein
VVAFFAGVLSFISPCVLPMVPAYLSMMSGVGVNDLSSPTRTDTMRLLRATTLFVAGFTVVLVLVGAGVGLIGEWLVSNQRFFELVSGALIILFGAVLIGFAIPMALERERRFRVDPKAFGRFGAPIMGAAFAFGWTPCIGPTLGAILTITANEGGALQGAALMTVYSLGLGVPFIVFGIGFGRLSGSLVKLRATGRVLNVVGGTIMIAFGLLLLTGNVSEVSRWWIDLFDSIGLDRIANI